MKFLTILFVIVVFISFFFLGSWILMLLWNWLLPYLFGLPVINIWQAAGVSILCSLFFGGARYTFKFRP